MTSLTYLHNSDVPFGVPDELYPFFGCSKTLSEIQSEPDIDCCSSEVHRRREEDHPR